MKFNTLAFKGRNHNTECRVVHVCMARRSGRYILYIDQVTPRGRYLLQGCDWIMWVTLNMSQMQSLPTYGVEWNVE